MEDINPLVGVCPFSSFFQLKERVRRLTESVCRFIDVLDFSVERRRSWVERRRSREEKKNWRLMELNLLPEEEENRRLVELEEERRRILEKLVFLLLTFLLGLGCLDITNGRTVLARLSCDLRVALIILLLRCEDVESNPGPDGKKTHVTRTELISLIILCLVMKSSAPSSGNEQTDHLRFQEGRNATISFFVTFQLDISDPSSLHRLLFQDSVNAPIFANDGLVPAGFKSTDQMTRFDVASSLSRSSLSVIITISPVTTPDQGSYTLVVNYVEDKVHFVTVTKTVEVFTPPGMAMCYITDSELPQFRDLHCHARSGNVNGTLTCFQDRQKVPYKGTLSEDTKSIRGVFWMNPSIPICCCSHEVHGIVTPETCSDYQWPPETEKLSSQSPPHVTEKHDVTGHVTTVPMGSSGSRSLMTYHVVLSLLLSVLAIS